MTIACLYFHIFSSLIEHINPRNIIDLLRTEFSGPNLVRMSPINSTERQFVKTIAEEIRKRETYFVSLCRDVLLEVLCYGDRRWLTKLERVGRRFHWMAENFFSARPFLRIDLSLKLNYSRLLIFICKKFIFYFHHIQKQNASPRQ